MRSKEKNKWELKWREVESKAYLIVSTTIKSNTFIDRRLIFFSGDVEKIE